MKFVTTLLSSYILLFANQLLSVNGVIKTFDQLQILNSSIDNQTSITTSSSYDRIHNVTIIKTVTTQVITSTITVHGDVQSTYDSLQPIIEEENNTDNNKSLENNEDIIHKTKSRGMVLCAGNHMVKDAMAVIDQTRVVWQSFLSITVAHCGELDEENIEWFHQANVNVLDICYVESEESLIFDMPRAEVSLSYLLSCLMCNMIVSLLIHEFISILSSFCSD